MFKHEIYIEKVTVGEVTTLSLISYEERKHVISPTTFIFKKFFNGMHVFMGDEETKIQLITRKDKLAPFISSQKDSFGFVIEDSLMTILVDLANGGTEINYNFMYKAPPVHIGSVSVEMIESGVEKTAVLTPVKIETTKILKVYLSNTPTGEVVTFGPEKTGLLIYVTPDKEDNQLSTHPGVVIDNNLSLVIRQLLRAHYAREIERVCNNIWNLAQESSSANLSPAGKVQLDTVIQTRPAKLSGFWKKWLFTGVSLLIFFVVILFAIYGE